jgi:hypothetical protein
MSFRHVIGSFASRSFARTRLRMLMPRGDLHRRPLHSLRPSYVPLLLLRSCTVYSSSPPGKRSFHSTAFNTSTKNNIVATNNYLAYLPSLLLSPTPQCHQNEIRYYCSHRPYGQHSQCHRAHGFQLRCRNREQNGLYQVLRPMVRLVVLVVTSARAAIADSVASSVGNSPIFSRCR